MVLCHSLCISFVLLFKELVEYSWAGLVQEGSYWTVILWVSFTVKDHAIYSNCQTNQKRDMYSRVISPWFLQGVAH